MSVANQNIIKIGPREPWDTKHVYTRMHVDAVQEAMEKLKGEHFKFWVYLNKNVDSYQLELSVKECEKWGIKKDAYYAAKKTLIALGYLEVAEGSNIYTFYEYCAETRQKKSSEIPNMERAHSEIQKDSKSSEIPKVNESSEIQKNSSENQKDLIDSSEIPKVNKVSENPKQSSEIPKEVSEIQKKSSEIPQRNIINITDKTEIINKSEVVDRYPTCTQAQLDRVVNGYEVMGNGLVRIKDTGKVFRIVEPLSYKDF